MEIIAHRGASCDAPENTLAAIRMAFEQQADACELDVHLSRDGAIVVIHDFTTSRVADVDWSIGEESLPRLKLLDVGRWKGPQWAGETIPTLEEALAILPPDKKLFIEIKSGAEILPELGRVLEAAGTRPDQISLIGFDFDTMRKTKGWLPELEAYWISAFDPDSSNGDPAEQGEDLVERAVEAGLDGLNLQHTGPIDWEFMQMARLARLKVYAWTVDDPETARRLASLGISGIATNRPGWMREKLRAELREAG